MSNRNHEKKHLNRVTLRIKDADLAVKYSVKSRSKVMAGVLCLMLAMLVKSLYSSIYHSTHSEFPEFIIKYNIQIWLVYTFQLGLAISLKLYPSKMGAWAPPLILLIAPLSADPTSLEYSMYRYLYK